MWDEDVKQGEPSYDWRVDVPDERYAEALNWVNDCKMDKFIMKFSNIAYFMFSNEKDAMMFKLMWG
jgi:hypothetical protein